MNALVHDVFDVGYKLDGTIWVHGSKHTFICKSGEWQVAVPISIELGEDYFFLNNSERAMKLIREAFAAAGETMPENIVLGDTPRGVPHIEWPLSLCFKDVYTDIQCPYFCED